MSKIQILLCTSFFLQSLSQNLFYSLPIFSIYTNTSTPQVVRIATDQSIIMVGYASGLVQTYSMTGDLIKNFTEISASIVDIQWGVNGIGPVALDETGKISWWVGGFSQLSTTIKPIGFSMIQSLNQTYVVLNFGTFAQECMFNSSGLHKTTRQYIPSNNTNFTQIMYLPNYTKLIVATNISTVQAYDCSNGQHMNVSFSTGNKTNVTKLSHYLSDEWILLTNASDVIGFDSNLSQSNIVTIIQESITITGCISGLIAIAQKDSKQINIWGPDGYFQQSLSYSVNSVNSLDCSANYLASIDDSHFLSVTTYSYTQSFPGWIIGLIMGAVVFTFIITLIVCCSRKKRHKAAFRLEMDATARKELLFTSPNTFKR